MWAIVGLVSAAVLLVVTLRPLIQPEVTVATLVSSENAAWESTLPTVPRIASYSRDIAAKGWHCDTAVSFRSRDDTGGPGAA